MLPFNFRLWVLNHFLNLSWQGVFVLLATFVSVSWIGLYLCDESKLVDSVDFIYWLLVTASTVGYGDLSPSSSEGKLFVSFFVIPFGVGLFAMLIGRIAAFAFNEWKKGVRGLRATRKENHIVVIGWNDGRTLNLLHLLHDESEGSVKPDVVLCVDQEIENPLPDLIDFVSVGKFNHTEDMARANLKGAKCIVIDTLSDDVSMTTALFCNQQNPDAHIIVYFQDESLSDLLKSHCPNVECTPSVSIEMMAKSAMDPGSSALHHELLSANKGMTQYSVIVPQDQNTMPLKLLFEGFKSQYDATVIAIRDGGIDDVIVNPPLDHAVKVNDTLYYIADDRIQNIQWAQFNV